MHHYKLIFFYIVTGLLTRGWCLTKPQVEIGYEGKNSTSKYITLGKLDSNDEPYSLDCIFDLDEGEELESVIWYYDKVDEVGSSIFSWKPNKEPQVSGFLVGRVNMTRNDGMIEFLERHREYEGFYSCEVKTNAESAMSESFQLVMADFGSRSYYSSSSIDEHCVDTSSLKTPALYPPPQIEYGVWNGENWVEKVQLTPIHYSNGSRQYILQDHKFQQVDKYPEGSKIRLTVGFIIQEEYVQFWTATSSILPCIKKEIDDGNTDDDDGGDSGGDNSNDGSDDGGKNVATSWPVNLAASATVVLCLLYVHH